MNEKMNQCDVIIKYQEERCQSEKWAENWVPKIHQLLSHINQLSIERKLKFFHISQPCCGRFLFDEELFLIYFSPQVIAAK